jgi:hypothetical protein
MRSDGLLALQSGNEVSIGFVWLVIAVCVFALILFQGESR